MGYERHQEPPGGTGNSRNGSTAKTLATEHGPVEIKTPRDRNASFEPQLVRKGQRRFEGFDDKILAPSTTRSSPCTRGLVDPRYRATPGRAVRRQRGP
jgi:transposase-like protein